MPRFAAPRLALLPAFESAPATLRRALDEGGAPLEALIIGNYLGPLWHAATNAEVFKASRHHATQLYMTQRATLHEIDNLLTRGGIRYAVIKGAAVRELIYTDPALRVCSDIDILVAPDQRVAAAKILVDSGYRLVVNPSLASHEVVLSKGIVSIDLHWDILRPGRTRVPVTAGMLARRQRHDGVWMLADTDALFLMLVHAAVSKHVNANMGLHRVAEIALWWQRRGVDWPAVHRALTEGGLKTGAWTVLSWAQLLSPPAFGAAVTEAIDSLRPGRLRGAYLKYWLNHELPARLAGIHVVRLLGFSVLLHDRWSGAWHGLEGWRRARRMSSDDAGVFQELM